MTNASERSVFYIMYMQFDEEVREISVILLDLDGTLLNSEKQITQTNVRALRQASEEGTQIVPCTGRFYDGMPEAVRALDFVSYALCINGAQVVNAKTKETIAQTLLSKDNALEVMRYLDTLPVIYDCFIGNGGFMSHKHKAEIDLFAPDEHYRKMLMDLRKGVEDVKEVVGTHPEGVSKIQFYVRDMTLRERLLAELAGRFPFAAISSSVVNNVEINDREATKGNALKKLADYLKVPVRQTMAFGDGLNDRTMIEAAGVGVAMGNAHPSIKEIADLIAPTCDEDGVGAVIMKHRIEKP